MSSTDTPETPDGDDEESPSYSTTSIAKRFKWTNDGLAFLLIGAFTIAVILDALGRLTLSNVPNRVLLGWLLMVGTAAVWAFGTDAIDSWRGK